jgi:hypothetical protein
MFVVKQRGDSMTMLLLDGSNVALNGAATGKLQTLSRLSDVIGGLIEHGHAPYTIFDANFRWRLPEKSDARIEFELLTKRVSDYFQLAPRGEEADLFLLESALTLEIPVLSNDTFRQYGKLKSGMLSYKGSQIAVYNFQVFAGVLVVPDLEIRWKIIPTGRQLKDIAASIEAMGGAVVESVENLSPTPVDTETKSVTNAELAPDPPAPDLDEGKVSAIARVIRRAMSDGQRSIAQLAGRLRDHRKNYQQVAGLGDKNKKRWFGYPTLDDFIKQRLPQFRVKDGKIEDPSEAE